jgi:hypothetical protein
LQEDSYCLRPFVLLQEVLDHPSCFLRDLKHGFSL